MTILNDVSSINWEAILCALFCGGFIGLERQLRGKAAGMRTSILIVLGTVTFIQLGATSLQGTTPSGQPIGDPTRVLGQVITGIGFLGAGVIMTRGGTLAGVTSASVVWVLAAIGCAIGFGRYIDAIIVTMISVLVLSGVSFFESHFLRLRPEHDVHRSGYPDLSNNDHDISDHGY